MTKLSVNLNKVALLRNQRPVGYPSVIGTARTVIEAGAHGITVHPRPDERHIRKSDVVELSRMLRDETGGAVEFNLEGNPTPEFLALVGKVRPDQVTLVPDEPHAVTSDHGWDIAANQDFLTRVVGGLKHQGMRVSLFVDAAPEVVALARAVGADRVELYTEPYAAAFGTLQEQHEYRRCVAAGAAAREQDLGLNAGHDLTRDNLPKLVAGLPWLLEVSIGHALAADALQVGYAAAVKGYLKVLSGRPEKRPAARPAADALEASAPRL